MRTLERTIPVREQRRETVTLVGRFKEAIKRKLALPDTIGVLMQKFREFALDNKNFEQRDKKAESLYPLFLSQYKVGIQTYEIYARTQGLPFLGEVVHEVYPNQKLVIKDEEYMCIYSTQKSTEDGKQGDYVEICGSKDGKEVYEVRYERWQKGTEIEYAQINYNNNGAAARCSNYLR